MPMGCTLSSGALMDEDRKVWIVIRLNRTMPKTKKRQHRRQSSSSSMNSLRQKQDRPGTNRAWKVM